MKITILIDNTPDARKALEAEHGLSMLVEAEKCRVLVDTGLSGRFADNAARIGARLDNLDFCFLSHGHNDHTGGLRRLMEAFPGTRVYLSDRIFGEHYSTSRHGAVRDLSTDADTLQKYADCLCPVTESTWITDRIAAVFTTHAEYARPLGNAFLWKEAGGVSVPDDFRHEMAMAVVAGDGLVVFSSCSHGGAANIMKSCQDFTGRQQVKAFVGGLHFVDGPEVGQEVAAFAGDLKTAFPHTKIFTGHCTSDKAKDLFAAGVPDIHFFRTGEEFEI